MIALATLLCLTACPDSSDDPVVTGVTAIEVVSGSIPTQVNLGETPDFSGIKVKATFEDGTTKEVGIADGVTVSSLDTTTAGSKSVTVTYGGKSAKVSVTVIDPDANAYVTAIKIVAGSVSESYYLGIAPNMSSLQIEATYSNGNTGVLDSEEYTYTGVDVTSEGKKTFTVTYTDDPTLTASAEYEVIGIKSMHVNAETISKKVGVGEALDTSALQVIVVYNDDHEEHLGASELTLGALDTTTYGDKTLTISFAGETIDYKVTVVGVLSVEVNKGSYPEKALIDVAYTAPSITAVASYSDGSEKTLSAADLSLGTLDTSTVGKKTLTVAYGGLETTVEVEVVAVESLVIVHGGAIKTEILKGESLDLSGISASATFTGGTVVHLDAADLVIGSIDGNVAGEQKLTITYLNKTLEYTVKVCEITSLRVEGVAKVVPVGEAIDISGMKVYGVYNNTAETEVLLTDGITTNVDDIDITVEGNKTLVVSYSGEYGTLSQNYVISAEPLELESIEIRSWKDHVVIDGTYDLGSLAVYAIYSNGEAEKITNYEVSALDTSVAGATTLTVTYTDGDITKSATVEVSVLPASYLILNGVSGLIADRGGKLDLSKLKVIVAYSDGTNEELRVAHDSDVQVLPYDTSEEGYKTLTVSCMGVEATATYYVRVVTNIAILGGSVDTDLRNGYDADSSNLTLNITYSNGDKEQKKASGLVGVSVKTEQTNAQSGKFTVTYEGCSASVDLTVINAVRISALNNTVPALVNQGDVVDYSTMKLSVYYDNGAVYLIPFTDARLTVTPKNVDTTTSGWKAISFVFADGAVTLDTSVNIHVRGVEKVEIVGGVLSIVTVGKKLDTSDISVKVTYEDGTYTYVNRNNPNLVVGTVDTSSAKKVTLVVSYLNKEGSMEIEVKEAATLSGLIFGTLLPDELVARESYAKNYKDSTSAYRVGDDNPYYFYLNVIQLDENDNIVDVDGKNIATSSKVYLVNGDGSETELTGSALTEMVAFDSAMNSYDFTDKAIGKTFRLEIWPADSTSYVDKASVTKSHTVTVVDGYNIYNAWELNVITNTARDCTNGFYGDEGAINQVQAVDKFLKKYGVTRPTTLASVVLHCNLDVTTSDIPSEYIYTYQDNNGVTQQGLYDHLGIFHRELTPDEKKFEIYGNYFSIYSYNLPCVTPKGIAGNDDEFSSASLIKVRLTYAAEADINARGLAGDSNPFDEYVFNVNDLATRDNDPNSNDQTASERHMRGLCCYKTGELTCNMTNVNVDAFMTSLVLEFAGTTLNLNKVKFYNAWQGHLLLWSENELQSTMGGKNQDTWSYIPDQVVNITDSLLAKCGGPVMLVQAPNCQENYNKTNGVRVIADTKSEIYTYVTGQEAWFVAVGQTQLAANIKAMSALISGQNGQNGPHGFISTDKIQGVEAVNMIMVSMGGDGTSLNGTYTNASFTRVGETNTTGMVSHYKNYAGTTFQNPYVDAYAASGAPVFQTSTGSTAYTDGKTGCYVDASGTRPGEAFYTGDYITLYYGGAAIMMEYYHTAS